ncbi:enediyne biosynthesis protein UnbU [Actinosynnema sp. CS-041913]|uniref:enediyne biosynthesis protein UnbU n=1 Tax=Actinosynnema sp. CS-041913 TaxID=3239917 RepID=UPI003D8CE69C
MTSTVASKITDATSVAAPHTPGDAPTRRPGLPPEVRRTKALARFATTITIFTVVGHLLLGFEQSPITPVVAVLTGYATVILFETLDAWAHDRRPGYAGGRRSMVVFLLPAHITALACAMLLWGNSSVWPYVFAVAVANGSKYLFRVRVRGKARHVFNPSNFGIAVVLVLFPWVGIAPPYQFTSNTVGALDWLLPLGILMFGTMLNVGLTGKWPLILAWVAGFAAQAVVRWAVLDHALLGALLPMTGLAFVLFTNYMITDPATSPLRVGNQVVFGLTTAAVYGVLVVSEVSFGLFFALVITCLLRGVVQYAAPRLPRSWMSATRDAG